MRYRLRTLLIVAAMVPAMGPMRLPKSMPEPSKLRAWKPESGRDAPTRSLTDEEFRSLPIDEQVRRVDEWQRFQNPGYSERLDPSYPLYYGF